MATIEKRTTPDGKTAFRVKVRMKGWPTQSGTFERLTDAKNWAASTEAAIREGRFFKTTESKRHTLADLVNRYLRDVMPGKPKSAADQTQQLTWWRDQIGDRTLADVTPALIAEYRDKLAGGVTVRGTQRSPATVNRYLAALSHAFSVAVTEWAWLDDSPMRKVRKPTESRGRIRFLSDAERGQLLKACKESGNPCLYPAVVLALSTGMRKNEIMGLSWDSVDLPKSRVILHDTKNKEPRRVALAGHALDLVRELNRVQRIDSRLLFPSKDDPKKPMDIRAPWEAALTKAEIRDFRFHDLRHSAASYLAMNGASLVEIAEILGHKTLQMVRRYAHLSEGHTAGVVESMNSKIFG